MSFAEKQTVSFEAWLQYKSKLLITDVNTDKLLVSEDVLLQLAENLNEHGSDYVHENMQDVWNLVLSDTLTCNYFQQIYLFLIDYHKLLNTPEYLKKILNNKCNSLEKDKVDYSIILKVKDSLKLMGQEVIKHTFVRNI